MKLLNVKYDAPFKALFEGNEELLLSFINAVTNRNIVKIISLNTAIKPVGVSRGIIMDILVEDVSGVKINVEMEKNATDRMKQRTQFYWAKAFSKHLKSRQDFKKLKSTICINVLGKNIFVDDVYRRKFVVYDVENKERLDDMLEIHFIELEKIKDKPIKSMLDSWMQFLNNSEDSYKLKGINPVITRAVEVLESLSYDENILREVIREEQEESEFISALNYAEEKGMEIGIKKGIERGIERGIEQGIERGIEQGKKERDLEIARQMLDVLDNQTIANKIGLTVEEVQNLRK